MDAHAHAHTFSIVSLHAQKPTRNRSSTGKTGAYLQTGDRHRNWLGIFAGWLTDESTIKVVIDVWFLVDRYPLLVGPEFKKISKQTYYTTAHTQGLQPLT